MRHGIAAPLGGEIRSDAARPLTSEGLTRTQEVAAGLCAFDVRPNLIASSPLLRALQTAEIVRDAFSKGNSRENSRASAPQLETWPEMEYAEYSALLPRLKNAVSHDTVLLVGHEPGLSRLAAHLLTGSPTGFMLEFKKAAVCALEISFDAESTEQRAALLWHMGPRQLRLMG